MASGINGAGQIVGSYYDAKGNEHGYLYSKANGWSTIGCTVPNGITNNRQVICMGGSYNYVYLYDVAHGTTQQIPCIGDPDPGGGCPRGVFFESVNDNAVLVGTYQVGASLSGCYGTPNP
jgi:hypothetical protein